MVVHISIDTKTSHFPNITRRFLLFNFRCGLDQNMIVLSGIEWRNPPSFHHTPYLLRIDELSFIVDAASVLKAMSRTGAIKVRQCVLFVYNNFFFLLCICVSRACVLYITLIIFVVVLLCLSDKRIDLFFSDNLSLYYR